MSDSGASGIVMVAIVGAALVASFLIADLSVLLAARLDAAGAADAAALAAAPATFPQGRRSERPAEAAGRVGAANGVRVVACRCSIDPSWAPRRVEVVVARDVDLVILGPIEVHATGAAEFAPTRVVGSSVRLRGRCEGVAPPRTCPAVR